MYDAPDANTLMKILPMNIFINNVKHTLVISKDWNRDKFDDHDEFITIDYVMEIGQHQQLSSLHVQGDFETSLEDVIAVMVLLLKEGGHIEWIFKYNNGEVK